MTEAIHFHSDLYRREALQSAGKKFGAQARIELAESNGHIVVSLEPLVPMSDAEARALRDAFCTEALSCTVRELRESGGVTWRGAQVTIKDWDKLVALAQFDPTYLHLNHEGR